MYKAAKAIFRHNDSFFLQLRDNKYSIPYPNRWAFFGGRILKNETPPASCATAQDSPRGAPGWDASTLQVDPNGDLCPGIQPPGPSGWGFIFLKK